MAKPKLKIWEQELATAIPDARYDVHVQQRTIWTTVDGLKLYELAAAYYAKTLKAPEMEDLAKISPLAEKVKACRNLTKSYERYELRYVFHSVFIHRMWPVLQQVAARFENCSLRIDEPEDTHATHLSTVTFSVGKTAIKLLLCNNLFSATAIVMPDGKPHNLCREFAEGILPNFRKEESHLENFVVRSDSELTDLIAKAISSCIA